MSKAMPNRRVSISRLWTMLVAFALVILMVGCNTSKPAAPAAETGPRTFASPDDAGAALLTAVKAGDHNGLLAIFGPGSADLIFSGDDAQDKRTGENFTNAYQTMNRWRKQTDGSEALVVGADNFLFPIPLKKNSAGQWYFDAMAGKQEILKRRIGGNELATIDVLSALTDAQAQYLAQHHDGVKQYAQRFVSDDGKENGLYWKAAEGQPNSPLGPLVAVGSFRRIHSAGGQAAALSRIPLSHPLQTGRRRSGWHERLHGQRQVDRRFRFHCLPGDLR